MSQLTVNMRISNIAKKLSSVDKALSIAKNGLSEANKGNPFITKSQAMITLNALRKYKRQLSNIWLLEFALIGS